MTKKQTLIAVAVVAVVAGGAFLFGGSGELFKGFIGQRVSTPSLSVTLDASSPSGSRNVTSNDNVALFKFCATGGNVQIRGLRLDMGSDDDFSTRAKTTVKDGSTQLGLGNLTGSYNGLFMDFPVGSWPLVKAGGCKTLTVVVDTAALMEEDVGTDDHLSIAIYEVFTSDKNVTVTSAMPVKGNTLKY